MHLQARYTRRLGDLHGASAGSGRSRSGTGQSIALPRMISSSAAVTAPLLPQAAPVRSSAVARARALRAASECTTTPSTLPLPFGEQLRRRAAAGGMGGKRKTHTPEMCHDVYLASSSDDETHWVSVREITVGEGDTV